MPTIKGPITLGKNASEEDKIKLFNAVFNVNKQVKKEEELSYEIPNKDIVDVIKNEWSEAGLFKLKRKQQINILESLGVEKIPKFEKNRVKLLLKLQSDGNELKLRGD